MPRSKVRFANSHGMELSGVLEMPELPAGMRAAHHAPTASPQSAP